MKKQASIFLCLLIISGLTSCNLPSRSTSDISGQEVALKYQTVSALLTATALVQPDTVSTPEATQQPTAATATLGRKTTTPEQAFSPSPVIKTPVPATKEAGISQAAALACDLAQPGRPIDITIPDDTHLHPGEYFSKTWRLVNAGSCSWTRDYAVVWFSGDDLGVNRQQAFSEEVAQGKSLDLTVDMIAPQAPGTYQSNWKLRNAKGGLFGIGPNGDAPFWVRIIVVQVDTPTATPTIEIPSVTPTFTPAPAASGTLALMVGDQADLDAGKLNPAEGGDVALQRADDKVRLAPLAGSSLAVYGVNAPGLEECRLAPLSADPLPLDQLQTGQYLCYRTGNGLPGRAAINALDVQKNQLSLEFLTWSTP